ncbi:hypothetical protein [Sphingomicrobium arenosum]|uniref:hypothetical protein n=1 Tax=Sphingomicrobium arenosum TaxID=2233861 RepID=UPI00223EF7FC|nr:hypothetical protein [Sphingomicrobium arenosum]
MAAMIRTLPLAICLSLAGCGTKDEAPPRPDERASERLASIEERLDAAEAADPTVRAPKEKGPDAEAPDPYSSD